MNFVICIKNSQFPKHSQKIVIFAIKNIQFKNYFMGHLKKMSLLKENKSF